MTSQSILTKNGQQLKVPGGAGAVQVGDVVLVGGPGNGAWTAGTADYASIPAAGTVLSPSAIASARYPGTSRQPIARDRVGNIYMIGTNGSGNLVGYKFNPVGSLVSSVILDVTATSVNTPQLFQLQSGAYCCVYSRAAGALFFVIFDSNLNIVAGPSNIATEYASTNIVYHASCSLSGGGFAVAYQTSAGTGLAFATFTNTGSSVLVPTNVVTFAGTSAQMTLRMIQLSNGNLAVGYRGTMTVNAIAGTGFVILGTNGSVAGGPTNIDPTSTAGFLELNGLSGFFAIAVANGANLIAAVMSLTGAIQGTPYSVGNTLNATTYPQVKLCNDGTKFWLTWFSSVSNGLYTIALAISGVSGPSASALGSSTLAASTFSLDAEVVNGLLVFIAASTALLGQFYGSIGLPDASLGFVQPYLRTPPTVLGAAAGTTGTFWPRVISSSAGLYQGTNAPASQPTVSPTSGDFTAIFAFDQVNNPQTFLSIQKLEASAIIGLALAPLAAGNPGTGLLVNPGPGEYVATPLAGTNGTQFNHIGLNPSGTAGALYSDGVGLTGMLNGPFNSTSTGNYATGDLKTTLNNPSNLIPQSGWLYMTAGTIGNAGSGATLRANADTQPLYTLLWNAFSNTICPVTGGRGSTAAADFSAGKPLAMIDARGCTIAAPDNQGNASFRGLLGNSTSVGGFTSPATLGTQAGQQLHTQTTAEVGPHSHTIQIANAVVGGSGGGSAIFAMAPGAQSSTDSTPAASGANVVQPTILANILIKL
jgi:hypothetical protein